jgi:predicted nucleic-acid-binding Zn-ribbon protein
MSQTWICPKCGSKKVTKPETYRMETRYGMSVVFFAAYVCDNCGYVELYKNKEQ